MALLRGVLAICCLLLARNVETRVGASVGGLVFGDREETLGQVFLLGLGIHVGQRSDRRSREGLEATADRAGTRVRARARERERRDRTSCQVGTHLRRGTRRVRRRRRILAACVGSLDLELFQLVAVYSAGF